MLIIPRASCGWVGAGGAISGCTTGPAGQSGPRCGKERIVKLVLTSHVVSDTPHSVHNTHSPGWVPVPAGYTILILSIYEIYRWDRIGDLEFVPWPHDLQ